MFLGDQGKEKGHSSPRFSVAKVDGVEAAEVEVGTVPMRSSVAAEHLRQSCAAVGTLFQEVIVPR